MPMFLLVVPVLVTLLIITALVLLMPLALLVLVLVLVLLVIAVFTIPLLAGIPPLLLVPLALNVVGKQLLPLLLVWNLNGAVENVSHASLRVMRWGASSNTLQQWSAHFCKKLDMIWQLLT